MVRAAVSLGQSGRNGHEPGMVRRWGVPESTALAPSPADAGSVASCDAKPRTRSESEITATGAEARSMAASAELTRQVLDPVDKAGQQVIRLPGGPDVRHPGQQLAQDVADLPPRQVLPEAEVRPRRAEPHVRVGGPRDVELVGGRAEHR